jgi:vacuolar-type H+-ATPase subunit I/STV1
MSRRAHRQTPERSEEENGREETSTAEDPVAKQRIERGGRTTDDGGAETTFEGLVEELIESHVEELEREIEALEAEIEEVDNFARISLNERKIKQAEGNLSEFSDSLTGFAEKAFEDINRLEERMDEHALLLSSVLDALSESDVDVDLEEVERYQRDQVIVDATPEERLAAAVDQY